MPKRHCQKRKVATHKWEEIIGVTYLIKDRCPEYEKGMSYHPTKNKQQGKSWAKNTSRLNDDRQISSGKNKLWKC